MSLYCGKCSSHALDHIDRDDRRNDDSLIAISDRYQCAYCGTRGTHYVYTDGYDLLTDCLAAHGHE
jgi:DNA-directed RNA polymerase subunit RPC12/RpoP